MRADCAPRIDAETTLGQSCNVHGGGPMPSFSLAILDYDRTLVDSFPWLCWGLNQTTRKFGFREVAQDEIDELRVRGTREVVAHFWVPKWELPKIAMHMRKLSAESRDVMALSTGVGPCSPVWTHATSRSPSSASTTNTPFATRLGRLRLR